MFRAQYGQNWPVPPKNWTFFGGNFGGFPTNTMECLNPMIDCITPLSFKNIYKINKSKNKNKNKSKNKKLTLTMEAMMGIYLRLIMNQAIKVFVVSSQWQDGNRVLILYACILDWDM
jgi:hypothetical protein